MDNIVIVGAGPMGREVYSWLIQHPEFNKNWSVKGFIDDIRFESREENDPINRYPISVIGKIENYIPEENDKILVAIGDPKSKRKIVSILDEKKVKYFTYLHPSVNLSCNVQIGKGSIICPNTVISCDTVIGNHVTINIACTIGHDVAIGDYSTLSSHVDITGNCCLGEEVFMGTHSALVPNTQVGKGAVVAAGSIGIRKVKESTTILGVPGKKFEIK